MVRVLICFCHPAAPSEPFLEVRSTGGGDDDGAGSDMDGRMRKDQGKAGAVILPRRVFGIGEHNCNGT